MRTLTINTFLSLDGVMQAPGGPDEDRSNGFAHGGWSVNYWDDVMGQVMAEFMGKPFDLVLGRKTYEIFAAHWPHVKDDPAAAALNNAKKYVASRTLRSLRWQNSQLLEGDAAQAIAKLKSGNGPELQVHGSAHLLQTLLKNNLIDIYRLWIFPLVLGSGKRLFADGTIPAGLKLVDSKTSSTGVLITAYQAAGAVRYGSFALAEPTKEEVERRKALGVGGR